MNDDKDREISSRGPELAVAALLAVIGAVVVADSLRVGTGWADDGPRAGYFPFYIGLLLLGASLWTVIQQFRFWADAGSFASRPEVVRVLAVLWPMVVHVAATRFIGIYLASAALIAWFMVRHGEHRAWVTAAVAVAVPLGFFVVFERWFLVPLPKGPLEAWLGF